MHHIRRALLGGGRNGSGARIATSNDLVGRSVTGWALWNSLPVYGTLILIVPLAVFIWSSSASRQLDDENPVRDKSLGR